MYFIYIHGDVLAYVVCQHPGRRFSLYTRYCSPTAIYRMYSPRCMYYIEKCTVPSLFYHFV